MNRGFSRAIVIGSSGIRSFLIRTAALKATSCVYPPNEKISATHLSAFIDDLCRSLKAGTENLPKKGISKSKRDQQHALNYWRSMDFPPNTEEKLSEQLVNQFGQDISRMPTQQLVHLLNLLADKNVRHEPLLLPICKRLVDECPTESTHIAMAIDALSRLTFLNGPLISKLKREFLTLISQDAFIEYDKFQRIVCAFAHLHLSDQHFWLNVLQFMETRVELIPKKHLAPCISALSICNVEANRAKQIVQNLVENLSRRTEVSPRNWLSLVHMLAVLQHLTPSLAESALNKHFLIAIRKQQTEQNLGLHTVCYDDLRINNICSATRLTLSDYKGPLPSIDLKNKEAEMIRQIKYGIVEQPALTTFGLLLRLVAPLKSHSFGPEWHPETGAMLEGRCFVDPIKKQLVPLREVQTRQSCKQVAILFFLENHMTRVFDPQYDVGPTRLLGIYQMSVRHLKAAGLHPVVFTESRLNTIGDNERAKVEYIRRRILNLSDDLHTNDWAAQPEAMDNICAITDEELIPGAEEINKEA